LLSIGDVLELNLLLATLFLVHIHHLAVAAVAWSSFGLLELVSEF
jgi:hypothetical protein